MTDPRMEAAREALIEQMERAGRPFSEVVQRGIRSGQWDKGILVQELLKNNYQNPLNGE